MLRVEQIVISIYCTDYRKCCWRQAIDYMYLVDYQIVEYLFELVLIIVQRQF